MSLSYSLEWVHDAPLTSTRYSMHNYHPLCHLRQSSSFHLFKGKAQRRWNGVRTPVLVIAPDHDGLSSSKDAFVIIDIVYLVLHDKAGASHPCYTDAHLGTVG